MELLPLNLSHKYEHFLQIKELPFFSIKNLKFVLLHKVQFVFKFSSTISLPFKILFLIALLYQL